MTFFQDITAKVTPDMTKRVKAVNVRVCASDFDGEVKVTDMQLQDGSAATGWVGHVSEIAFTEDGW